LLIKTSSLGDVIHNLPVVSDIRRHLPAARIDWVVEKSFAAIPRMHPAVSAVLVCELRRWRKSWLQRETHSEWRSFLNSLKRTEYDIVIDTQGLLKSALLTRMARGYRVGLDWRSSREPLRVFYDRTISVPWGQHAVQRNRRLAAIALGYQADEGPDYGLRCAPGNAAWLPRAPYAVLIHGTSDARKLWPEANWVALGERLADAGYALLLPWGTQQELTRARRMAGELAGALVVPSLKLGDLAAVLSGAAAAIGVDTGLTHLAAALGIPTVGIFGATDPKATGVCARTAHSNLGDNGRFPQAEEVAANVAALLGEGAQTCGRPSGC
jgi:heptosyltransferase-1